jgi:hypothetical protein
MPSDIRLTDDWVILEGDACVSKAPDLMIDNDYRRGGHTESPLRRALVHGEGDKLILNFNADYTGGTELHGPASFSETVKVTAGMEVGGPATFAGQVSAESLKIAGDVSFINASAGVINATKFVLKGSPLPHPMPGVDLLELIRNLQQNVRSLEARVAALEHT